MPRSDHNCKVGIAVDCDLLAVALQHYFGRIRQQLLDLEWLLNFGGGMVQEADHIALADHIGHTIHIWRNMSCPHMHHDIMGENLKYEFSVIANDCQ